MCVCGFEYFNRFLCLSMNRFCQDDSVRKLNRCVVEISMSLKMGVVQARRPAVGRVEVGMAHFISLATVILSW